MQMPRELQRDKAADLRRKTAREAATLLYFGLEKEYRQAKTKAAENLGTRILPSNLEIALEMDRLAEENEGSSRKERLIKMRHEALHIMKLLKDSCPILIGSVWRGTIKRASDIDIEIYPEEPERITSLLKAAGIRIQKTETIAVTEKGKSTESIHVFVQTTGKFTVEITVRPSEDLGKKRKCDTFGDEIKGLTIKELEKLLQEYPAKQFLPS